MKINVTKSLPRSWDDVTFAQALKLTRVQDTADTLAVFLNIEAATLRKAHISNLFEVLRTIEFLNTQAMPLIIPKSLNGFNIPINLEMNSICRYEDLKLLVQKVIPAKEGEPVTDDQLTHYAAMVGIYTMPNYETANPDERAEFSKQFYNAPCGEVMAIGNFTLRRFLKSKRSGLRIFQRVTTLIRRLRLALKSFNARLDFSLRYYIWKRKRHISGTKF